MHATSTDAKSWNTLAWLRSIDSVAIPVYQREYRWTQSACERLLADVVRVAQTQEPHFVGSVLAAVDDSDEVTLVDGQQRITTLMLMLAAVRDLAADSDHEAAAEMSSILLQGEDQERSKLRPHHRYEAVVTQLMRGAASGVGDSTFEANHLALLEMIGSDWRRVWQGLQRLEHVVIELTREANAQQIFESLNSTGARLADDELIHNYVHMGRVHSEQTELERDTWIPIEEATRGSIRTFWRDYLVWSSDEQVDMSDEFGIYRVFRRRYPDPRNDLTHAVRAEWVKHAHWYGVLLEPELEPCEEIADELRFLRSFEGTPRPLVLGMYGDYVEKRITQATLVDALRRLQTMLVRRSLVNLGRDLGMIGRLCRALRDEGYPLEGMVRLTPEDPQVRLALSHGFVPHAAYVLTRLQRPDKSLVELQIEHIHPQTPAADWSGDGGATTWEQLSNDEQAEYRTVLNTLGNLTLLEAPLNQGAGNRAFLHKAEKYYARSEVPATKALAARHAWGYEAITERTKRLTADFLQVWPRDSAEPMDPVDDLVRVVDVPRTPVRGYPESFEYAVFEGAVWGDVKNVKQLATRLAHELWSRDSDRLAAAEHGDFICKEREPRKSYERLPNGLFFYTGWRNQWLLEVAQGYIEAFDLHDEVRVKLIAPDGTSQ